MASKIYIVLCCSSMSMLGNHFGGLSRHDDVNHTCKDAHAFTDVVNGGHAI